MPPRTIVAVRDGGATVSITAVSVLLLCVLMWLAMAIVTLGVLTAGKRADAIQRAAWDEEVDRHARTLDFP